MAATLTIIMAEEGESRHGNLKRMPIGNEEIRGVIRPKFSPSRSFIMSGGV
jgi:hypothetical protein